MGTRLCSGRNLPQDWTRVIQGQLNCSSSLWGIVSDKSTWAIDSYWPGWCRHILILRLGDWSLLRLYSSLKHVFLVQALFTWSSILSDQCTFWLTFFVQKSQKTNWIKKFHRKTKLIKLNYKWRELESKKLSNTLFLTKQVYMVGIIYPLVNVLSHRSKRKQIPTVPICSTGSEHTYICQYLPRRWQLSFKHHFPTQNKVNHTHKLQRRHYYAWLQMLLYLLPLLSLFTVSLSQ